MELKKWYINEVGAELSATMKRALGCDGSWLHDLPSLSDWLEDGKTLSAYLDCSPLMPRGHMDRLKVIYEMGKVLDQKVIDESSLWDERDLKDYVVFDDEDEDNQDPAGWDY